ncbi:MAG: response regulator [Deltaproteobacteria bacterium]|nr:response regulator [Deltaproteobacteria bacterium]MBW2120493.1 response regulator [Deltaproteobacteria bacterium]
MEQVQILRREREIPREGVIRSMMRQSGIHKSKARILVVDDEPEIASVLRDLLVFAGFDVETAANGKQAIDLLTTARHFDLMITDMKMPEMDGLELLKMTHQLKKHLPVIILTGCATVDNGIHSLEEGAYDYVLKPFNTEKLILVVREALKYRS